jgi:peroxiredoxin
MNKLFLLFLFPVSTFAQNSKGEFQLKGKLNLAKPVDWVYLRYSSGDQNITDSVQAKNGEFKFTGNLTEPTVATLVVKFAKQQNQEKPARDLTQFFLEPAKMEFNAKDSLKNQTTKGSTGQADYAVLQKQVEAYDSRFETLYDQYDSLQKASDKEGVKKTEEAIEQLDKEMNEAVYASFLKKHPNSSVALYALKQYAGWDIDPSKVEPLFNLLPASEKSFPSAVALKQRIDIAKKTAVGNYAMDFTQNDTLGHPVSLSSFRGKYVLVDFWASWCGPCRRENPNVVKAFNRYKDKNFTILSVSLDQPNARDKWLAAIHKDGLTWTHVSDLKYWDNEAAKEYGIRAIPQNLLLDPKGKIIAKNLRGEDLESKLEEIIGK